MVKLVSLKILKQYNYFLSDESKANIILLRFVFLQPAKRRRVLQQNGYVEGIIVNYYRRAVLFQCEKYFIIQYLLIYYYTHILCTGSGIKQLRYNVRKIARPLRERCTAINHKIIQYSPYERDIKLNGKFFVFADGQWTTTDTI